MENYSPKIHIAIITQSSETLAKLWSQVEETNGNVLFHVLANGCSEEKLRRTLEDYCQNKWIMYSSDSNLGVAGGRQFILGNVKINDSDIIIFVDDDAVIVNPNWAVEILAYFSPSNEGLGIVGPGGHNVKWGYSGLFVPSPPNVRCDVVSGYCLAASGDVINNGKIRFDQRYNPFFEEDSDFCMQAWEAGWEVMCCYNTGLHHSHSNSGAHLVNRMVNKDLFKSKWKNRKLIKDEGGY